MMGYLGFVVFVLSVMGLPAGFVAWPLAWRYDASARVRRWARGLFWAHAIGVGATVALAVQAERGRWPDAYLWVLPLYLVGLLSLVAALVVTIVGVRDARRAIRRRP